MKIITIGSSPSLLNSRGIIHSSILKHCFQKDSVMALAWNHNSSYFTPEKDGKYYHKVNVNNKQYQIPVIPFQKNSNNASVQIYEHINRLKPDVIISIGDAADLSFIGAIKNFCSHNFKWICILTSSFYPINENYVDFLNEPDSIICTNQTGYDELQKSRFKDTELCYVGSHISATNQYNKSSCFRIMASPRNSQIDNIATLIEVVSDLKNDIPEIELYLHLNSDERGDYNIDLLLDRFDCKPYVKFPTKYVSSFDGLSEEEYSQELQKSHVFVSIPMISGTALSVFEAMSCGCVPVLSYCGTNKDICDLLEQKGIFNKNFSKVKGINLLGEGENYLYISDPEDLKRKIVSLYENNKGFSMNLIENLIRFSGQHPKEKLLQRIDKVIENDNILSDSLVLETVS